MVIFVGVNELGFVFKTEGIEEEVELIELIKLSFSISFVSKISSLGLKIIELFVELLFVWLLLFVGLFVEALVEELCFSSFSFLFCYFILFDIQKIFIERTYQETSSFIS